MFDMTFISCVAVGISASVLVVCCVPLINANTKAVRLRELLEHADIAVAVAEQRYKDNSDKKAYALSYLKDVGYDIHDQDIEDIVEAAVLKLHRKIK